MTHAPERVAARRWLVTLLAASLLATVAFVASPGRVQAATASDLESTLMALVNASRADAGLKALRTDTDLVAIAGLRATRMRDANTMTHTIAGSLTAQLASSGVPWYRYGENIGYTTQPWGSRAAESIHAGWMASPPHRALLLSTSFNYAGIGLAYRSSNGRTYASIVFTESPDRTTARASMVGVRRSGNDATWTFTGYDPVLQTHTAGLRDFDVQVRRGSNAWTTIRNDTTSRTYTLYDRSGGTYGVRVRATDRRGNVGPWTAETTIWMP